MREKNEAGPGRNRLNLETVIITGLSLKIILALVLLLSHTPFEFPLPATPALAQEKTPAAAPPSAAPASPKAASNQAGAAPVTTEALKAREDDLNRREARLKERETALDLLEKELAKRMSEIEATRKQLADLVKKHQELVDEQKKLKDARIEHLVTAYKGMRPEKAGALMNSLDDDVAVEILSAMPGRSAGQILAYIEPAKAARLTKAISERKGQQPEGAPAPAAKQPGTQPAQPAARPGPAQPPAPKPPAKSSK
ncbi:MAG: hypothetical protein AB1641_13880 [Thermodesulfobacteriota bacterium]